MGKRGVILLIVIGTILLVSVLAAVILSIITSQSRLTQHQISRIQAYYAAMAGGNYAMENLRTGNWTTASYIPTLSDTSFPSSIPSQSVSIVINPSGVSGCTPPSGSTACVSVTANYTTP